MLFAAEFIALAAEFIALAVAFIAFAFAFEALFDSLPPQAIPRAVKAIRPESAISFFILNSLQSFSKINLPFILPMSAWYKRDRPVSKRIEQWIIYCWLAVKST